MGVAHGHVRISCVVIIGKMLQYRQGFEKWGMRYGHGLNAHTVGCFTAGQTRGRVLRNT